MAKINIESGGAAPLQTGELQLASGVAMSSTLTAVTDQANTASPLLLSTTGVQVQSPLRITTSDASGFYIDAEDSATNNRFSVKRDPSSQLVTIDFASNPSGSTTDVGAIRTYQDGVNLSEVVKFREDGQVTFTERVNVEADSLVTTQSSSVIAATTTNANLVIAPNGTGALIAVIPDGTTTGGNARGGNAVDLQMGLRDNSNQVASGVQSFIGNGTRNRSNNIQSSVINGDQNLSSGPQSFIGNGSGNTASGQRSFIGNGFLNNATSGHSTISGGESNTASTNTHATVVGGSSNTSSGQYSVSGGQSNTASGFSSMAIGGSTSNVASGFGAIAIGGGTASSTRSVAIGRGTIVSGGDGSIAFMGGQVTDLGATESLGACAFGRSKTTSVSGFSFGDDSFSYLKNQLSQSPINIYGGNTLYYGYSQASQVVAVRQATLTTGGTTTLSLDGTGTTNLIIPNGNNRMWNVQVRWVAVVTAITGTATGVTVGDTKVSTDLLAVAKRGGVTTVGAHTSAATSTIETIAGSLAAANITYSAGASQEMAITFTGPTFAGGGSVTMRVVAAISLTEVAY